MAQESSSGDDSQLGVIILGASTFPHFRSNLRMDKEAFGRSAAAFRNLFEPADSCVRRPVKILDLFDKDLAPNDLVEAIGEFLIAGPSLRDVVIYYCGHGIFLADDTYVVLLKSTRSGKEAFTALPMRQFR